MRRGLAGRWFCCFLPGENRPGQPDEHSGGCFGSSSGRCRPTIRATGKKLRRSNATSRSEAKCRCIPRPAWGEDFPSAWRAKPNSEESPQNTDIVQFPGDRIWHRRIRLRFSEKNQAMQKAGCFCHKTRQKPTIRPCCRNCRQQKYLFRVVSGYSTSIAGYTSTPAVLFGPEKRPRTGTDWFLYFSSMELSLLCRVVAGTNVMKHLFFILDLRKLSHVT